MEARRYTVLVENVAGAQLRMPWKFDFVGNGRTDALAMQTMERYFRYIFTKIQVEIFWIVTPRSVMVGYQRFG
jgi:hypothetical protein